MSKPDRDPIVRTVSRMVGPALLAVLICQTVAAENWSRFRGETADAISRGAAPPVEWGDEKNLTWKMELPGPGVSSPIVVGDRVFVTCYSGYGVGGEDEKLDDLRRHLICVDRASGKRLWSEQIEPVASEDPFEGVGVTAHGYASHTPVSDGTHVYAFFGKSGVYAFTLDGKQKWQASVGEGSGPMTWGSAASPILNDQLLIVTASDESESIVALDKATGDVVWKTETQDLQNTWSTPVVMGDGNDRELVVNVPGKVLGFDLETGDQKWFSRGTTDETAAASLIPAEDMVIAVGGRNGDAVAVKTGGSGDVNDSNVIWDANIPGRFPTPILHDGHLYVYGDGVLSVYEASSGDRVAQKRLKAGANRPGPPGGRGGPRGEGRGGPDRNGPRGDRRGGEGPRGEGRGGEGGGAEREGGPPRRYRGGEGGPQRRRRGGPGGPGGGMSWATNIDYASPVLAGGRLYVPTRSGEVFVLEATPDLKLLSTNKLTDKSGFAGSPAVSDGQLFIRSGTHLYCIGEQNDGA